MPGYPVYAKRHESLSDQLRDLAGQFTNMATVLADQYANLNAATYGLLDGTFPWKGKGAIAFDQSWQSFGQYMQQLQQGCTDAAKSLNKFAQKMDDVEAQQAWDILLAVVGGLLTIISFAAAIAEFGLDPFVDGFTAFIAGFTEQEGADVVNVAEDISQADTEAASELQQIEDELSTTPTLSGNAITAPDPGDLPPVSQENIDEMTSIDDLTSGSDGNNSGNGNNGNLPPAVGTSPIGDPPGGWERVEPDIDPRGPEYQWQPSSTTPQEFVTSDGSCSAGLYPDGELEIGWITNLRQLLSIRSLVNWLGDGVQTIKGYVTDGFYEQYFSTDKLAEETMARLNQLASTMGFQGSLENIDGRFYIIFTRVP